MVGCMKTRVLDIGVTMWYNILMLEIVVVFICVFLCVSFINPPITMLGQSEELENVRS
jgi:hypothetical protein